MDSPGETRAPWLEATLDELGAGRAPGYARGAPAAAEPTALGALALAAHGRRDASRRLLDWLADRQQADGSLGACETLPSVRWPTSLAVLAWARAGTGGEDGRGRSYRENVERGARWLLTARGEMTSDESTVGHDTRLVGWPWVQGTHSWVGPTALGLLALKAAGHDRHPRSREAARLLVDRLLPGGGCNYGNTRVLGRELRPHLDSAGLAATALAGEDTEDSRVRRTLDFLMREVSGRTPSISLGLALTGLAAHGLWPAGAEAWLAPAHERLSRRGGPTLGLAWLCLAALKHESPMIPATVRTRGPRP